MSYRNPKQYIDTQSMQIQQNLQSNLANIGAQTVSNISKVYEENRKKTEEIIKAADTATDKISQNIYQTQAKDPTIKMGNMYEVSKHVNNLMKMDPLTLTDSQRNTISSFKTLGTRMASMLESTYAVNPSDVLAKGKNAPGGLNSYFNPGKTKLILASANKIDSDKTAVFPIDNRGNIGFNVEFRDVGAGGDVKPFGVLNNPMPLAIDTIPDIVKSEEDANKISFGQFLLNDRFSDIYKPIKDKDGNIIEEGEIASETQPNGVTITGRRPVKARMRKIIDANYFEKSNYETLSKSQKVALYRTLVFKKGGKEFGTVEGSDVIDVTKVTPEDLEYMLQAKLDQNYEVMKQTYPEMEKTLGDIGTLPKTPKPTKLTEADKKFKGRVSLGKEVLNEIKSLTDNKKQKGSKNFSLDKLGAFVDVINSKRRGSDPKIVRTEDLKALYLRLDENTEESWEDVRPKTDLAYRTSSGAIIPVDISDPKKLNNSMLDLLIPGIKPSERDRLLKAIIGGNQDRPKLP